MSSFNDAAQARLSLKMLLSNYWWYEGSVVISDGDSYSVIIYSQIIDNDIKKLVPTVHKDVSVKLDNILKKRKDS